MRGFACVLPLHPRLRHHLARRDRGLDPVLGLTLDLAPTLRRRRVQAGLHRPPQFSDQSEDESPPLRDEETLDLGIPPLGDRSALDHKLLTTVDKLDWTPAVAPEPTPGTFRAPPSVYTRLGPPTDTVADTAREPVRSWRESWESPDFRFSRPVEFVPVIQALAKVLNFKPPATTSIQEDSQFSVWATASSRTVIVPTPWKSDQVIRPLLELTTAESSRKHLPLATLH